ncbi:MAG: hypothetical protein QM817_03555 [Archangium sp.]
MSSVVALFALIVAAPPSDPWLGNSRARIDFDVSTAAAVSAGYSLRLNVGDAGSPNAVGWWDGGWLLLPIARDTDPASNDVWFSLPFALDGGESLRVSAFFESGIPSLVDPSRVFLRYDDFASCSFGTWQRRNEVMLQAIDSNVSHRDGGCSARLDATLQNFTTLVSPETYQSVAFDVWWMADAPNDMVWGNSFHLQSNALDGYSFGFIQGFGGWVSGRLVNTGANFNAGNNLVEPGPSAGKWQRVVAYVTPGSIRGCVDEACVDDTMLTPPGATFDGGSVGLGRRVTSPTTDGGMRAWADDVIARRYQRPEPVAIGGQLTLGPGIACTPTDLCFTGVCTAGVCPVVDAGVGDAGSDAGIEDAGSVDAGDSSRRVAAVGCGCSSGVELLAVCALALTRRRRARSTECPRCPSRTRESCDPTRRSPCERR